MKKYYQQQWYFPGLLWPPASLLKMSEMDISSQRAWSPGPGLHLAVTLAVTQKLTGALPQRRPHPGCPGALWSCWGLDGGRELGQRQTEWGRAEAYRKGLGHPS